MPREPLDHRVIVHGHGFTETLFNQARTHRYLTARHWGTGHHDRPLTVITLHPPASDSAHGDPVWNRALWLALREQATSLTMIHLFAHRAPEANTLLWPRFLVAVGEWNDEITADVCIPGRLPTTAAPLGRVLAAWGPVVHPALRARAILVEDMLAAANVPVWCLGTGRSSHPKTLPGAGPDARFQPYSAAAWAQAESRTTRTVTPMARPTRKDATVGNHPAG